jgi:hypothetical protein
MHCFDAARVADIADGVRLVVDHRAQLLERTDNAQYRTLIDLIARWHVLDLAAGLQDSAVPDLSMFVPVADSLYVPLEDVEQRILQCIGGDKAFFVSFMAWARGLVPGYGLEDDLLNALTGNVERRRLVKQRAGRLRATIGVGTSRPH